MVGPLPLKFSDNCTFTIPAFKLPGGFTCAGDGLCYEKVKRLPAENLAGWINGSVLEKMGKEEKKIHQSRVFWAAQCAMYLLPEEMLPNNANIGTMKKRLSAMLDSRGAPPPAVAALETAANEQFNSMLEKIRNIISTTRYVAGGIQERMKHNDGKRPSKRRRRSTNKFPHGDSASENEMCMWWDTDEPTRAAPPAVENGDRGVETSTSSHLPPELALPARPSRVEGIGPGVVSGPQPTPLKTKKQHSRGDCKSGAANTARYRLRAPRTAAKSYLLQLMVDPGNLERAISVTERSNCSNSADNSTSREGSAQDHDTTTPEGTLRRECRQLVTACILGLEDADTTSYESMKLRFRLALWYLTAKKAYPKLSVTLAWKKYIKNSGLRCTLSKFRHLHSNGHNLLRLANASSIHILSPIAVSALRDVTNHLCEPEISEIENALRRPDILPGAFGSLICTGIIQVIRQFQRQFPTGVELGGRVFGVNLEEDDRYFAELLRTEYAQAPRGSAWYDDTRLFPEPPRGKQTAATGTSSRPKNNGEFTEQQRAIALQALTPATLGELRDLLRERLASGVSNSDTYVKISQEHYAQNNILVHGKGGKEDGFICLVFGKADTLSIQEEKYMTEITQLTLQMEKDKVVDTSEAGSEYVYPGFHYGAWGKMAKSGKIAPKNLHPRLFIGESSQPAPYLDRAVRVLADCFNKSHFMHCPHDQFNRAIESILPVAIEKLRREVPSLLDKHQGLFDSLSPSMTLRLGSSPFCMTVLNVQPATRAHRDSSDELDSICLILPLGDYEGGDLCLYEPRLRIELPPGAFCAIRSKRNLHFNLHFKGQRFSYVFTSDAGLRRWEERRNDMECLQRPSTSNSSSKEQDQEDKTNSEEEELSEVESDGQVAWYESCGESVEGSEDDNN
ncbi:DEAD-box ATP-dependent RNA helicase 42 [Ceratobasidium sp. AG-Ba]|nr:DEAD-box ATP-dependent RNA helicase 42 [Ceratobasidium sp. AG-Ba]